MRRPSERGFFALTRSDLMARGVEPGLIRQKCGELLARGVDLDGSRNVNDSSWGGCAEVLTRSHDGTVKALVDFGHGRKVETVMIPGDERSTACISVQVGCRRACRFCATGRMGLRANLESGEIVAQVAVAARMAYAAGAPPLRNVVLMGMGEPLDNARRVGRALDILTDAGGWAMAPRHITVSTVAPSARAIDLVRRWPCQLAWSLHAADDALRRRLIPTARTSVHALAAAFLEVVASRNKRLLVELTLLDGVNDDLAAADSAANLFRGSERRVRFNLLPCNPTDSPYRPSPPPTVRAFALRLRERGYFAMVRRPRGQDQAAACGQLVTLVRR